MSTTYPTHDSLRIPPKPRLAPKGRAAEPAAAQRLAQLAFSAVAGFGLAWLLSRLIIG
jgi:hypothetical protein